MRKPPKARSDGNTSLTISLPSDLKQRIQQAANDDRRPVSPWVVIQLENILDEIEAAQPLAIAAETKDPSEAAHLPRQPVSYPAKGTRKPPKPLESIPDPPREGTRKKQA